LSDPTDRLDRPSQLDEGEIWVEYHPASGRHPEILRPQGAAPFSATTSTPYDMAMPPWHPFRTRADFEQAELFLRHDCTDSYINAQLKLIHSGSPLGHSITLESAKEMHTTLAQIPHIEDLPGVYLLNDVLSVKCANCLKFSLKQLILRFRILAKKIAVTLFAVEAPFSQQFWIFLKTIFWQIVSAYIQNVGLCDGLEEVLCGFGKKTHLVMTGGMPKFVFMLCDNSSIDLLIPKLRHVLAKIRLSYIFSFMSTQLM
jgi:hypothetical protein